MNKQHLKIFSKNEKREILNKLKKQFGISSVPGTIIKKGKERIFLYQGSLAEKHIRKLDYLRINLERIGVYFAKIIDDKIRLSIEGVHLLKEQITNNIFELTEEQAEEWMKGQELYIKTGKKEFLIMKYKEDFLGCGKASENKISNYIPKSRRLKK